MRARVRGRVTYGEFGRALRMREVIDTSAFYAGTAAKPATARHASTFAAPPFTVPAASADPDYEHDNIALIASRSRRPPGQRPAVAV
jgi:hypothetical protein